jgi:hypothetical protein
MNVHKKNFIVLERGTVKAERVRVRLVTLLCLRFVDVVISLLMPKSIIFVNAKQHVFDAFS